MDDLNIVGGGKTEKKKKGKSIVAERDGMRIRGGADIEGGNKSFN